MIELLAELPVAVCIRFEQLYNCNLSSNTMRLRQYSICVLCISLHVGTPRPKRTTSTVHTTFVSRIPAICDLGSNIQLGGGGYYSLVDSQHAEKMADEALLRDYCPRWWETGKYQTEIVRVVSKWGPFAELPQKTGICMSTPSLPKLSRRGRGSDLFSVQREAGLNKVVNSGVWTYGRTVWFFYLSIIGLIVFRIWVGGFTAYSCALTQYRRLSP